MTGLVSSRENSLPNVKLVLHLVSPVIFFLFTRRWDIPSFLHNLIALNSSEVKYTADRAYQWKNRKKPIWSPVYIVSAIILKLEIETFKKRKISRTILRSLTFFQQNPQRNVGSAEWAFFSSISNMSSRFQMAYCFPSRIPHFGFLHFFRQAKQRMGKKDEKEKNLYIRHLSLKYLATSCEPAI